MPVVCRSRKEGTRPAPPSLPDLHSLGRALGPPFSTRSAGCAGTTAAALSARTALNARTLWPEFVAGELAVGILVELLQRLTGLGDLFGVERAVLVQIERLDDRIGHALAARATGSTAFIARTAPWAAWVASGTRTAVLRVEETR